MSRGVYVPCETEYVIYFPVPDWVKNSEWGWDDLIDSIRDLLHSSIPSLYETSDWHGKEGYIFMENKLIQIGISEFGGVIAVWVIPQTDYYGDIIYPNLMGRHIDKTVIPAFEKLLIDLKVTKLELLGHFSNGEPVYKEVK